MAGLQTRSFSSRLWCTLFSSAPSQLLALARKAATSQSLDPALVCAVIEQESGWSPWAMRYEPAFFSKYVAPLYTNNKISATEAYARGFSWGLMQVTRQKVRDAQLAQTLAEFAAEKRATQTPAQIIRELPRAIPLPTPLALSLHRRM